MRDVGEMRMKSICIMIVFWMKMKELIYCWVATELDVVDEAGSVDVEVGIVWSYWNCLELLECLSYWSCWNCRSSCSCCSCWSYWNCWSCWSGWRKQREKKGEMLLSSVKIILRYTLKVFFKFQNIQ
ncbi:unnamed protein product [Blepharisma stoltei]|uniref:Uncharacterized protein n=1 Tax=Blepharisma stoltei TaxID=1481888 RepID=A0AAU9KD45_9CILI|nr:unnamed protein product [Blepharisma stoltei]